MNKKTLVIGFSVIVTLLFISTLFSSNANEILKRESVISAITSTIELDVKGFTCTSCVYIAKIVLEDHEGVISAEIDYGSGKALVKFDNERITPQQIADLLNENTPYVATITGVSPKTLLN